MNFVNSSLSPKARVLEKVAQIPLGKLTTYGAIGKLTGVNPRQVGWILSGFTDEEMQKYPWQRVLAKHGIVSSLKLGPRGALQIEILKQEGFEVEGDQVVDFEDYLDSASSPSLFA
jgi:methylated-DNA-protein-cysteine methyltransferase related protein